MVQIPPRVRATPPVYKAPGITAWYQPTNTRRDLPPIPEAQARGAMDDFLVSPELQETILKVAADMEADARDLALSEGVVQSGDYVSKFDHKAGPIVVINDGTFSNPRVSAEVGNESEHAVVVEFGMRGRKADQPKRGHRILGKIAEKYDNPKGGA